MMDRSLHRVRGGGFWLVVLVLLAASGCQTPTMMRERGERAMEAGDYQTALEELEDAAEARPHDMRIQYQLGRVYLELGELRRAQRSFERALTLAGSRPARRHPVADKLAETLYQREAYERLGDFLDSQARRYGTVTDHLRQGEYLQRTGDLDGARLAYRKAAYFADSDDARPYVAMADFYESLNDMASAIQALRWAYYADADHPGLSERFRQAGIVPGPGIGERPPRAELLRRGRPIMPRDQR